MERPAFASAAATTMREPRYHVYIMASRSHTLYIGITSAIERRIKQHKGGTFEGFSSQYNCNRLVYLEAHDDVHHAIAREKQLKRWSRAKKITLIERHNPTWHDLSEDWGKPIAAWDESAGNTGGNTGLSTSASPPVEMTEGERLQRQG